MAAEARRQVAAQMTQLVADVVDLRKRVAAELGAFDLSSVQAALIARAQGYVQSGNQEDLEREQAFAEQLKQKDEQLRQKDAELAQLREQIDEQKAKAEAVRLQLAKQEREFQEQLRQYEEKLLKAAEDYQRLSSEMGSSSVQTAALNK